MLGSCHFVCQRPSAATSLTPHRVVLLPGETEDTSSRKRDVQRSRHCVVVVGLCALFIFTAKMPELAVENVVVHPLVLLSVVDHFNR